jgi:hypothetical protein
VADLLGLPPNLAPLLDTFLRREFYMTNDAEVFYAKRFDPQSGTYVRADRTGTREAIHRDGFVIDPMSQAFCPPEWLDERGYVDLELARKQHD